MRWCPTESQRAIRVGFPEEVASHDPERWVVGVGEACEPWGAGAVFHSSLCPQHLPQHLEGQKYWQNEGREKEAMETFCVPLCGVWKAADWGQDVTEGTRGFSPQSPEGQP